MLRAWGRRAGAAHLAFRSHCKPRELYRATPIANHTRDGTSSTMRILPTKNSGFVAKVSALSRALQSGRLRESFCARALRPRQANSLSAAVSTKCDARARIGGSHSLEERSAAYA
jgi:hypothetical protein